MKKRATNQLKQKTDKVKHFLKRKHPVRHLELTMGMMRVIILGWLVPFLTFSVALFLYSKTKTDKQIKDTITTSVMNAANICDMNLVSAIEQSKQVTYDGVVKRSYDDYLETGDEVQLYKQISSYLNNRYGHSSSIAAVFLLFKEDITKEYYTYSYETGATFSNVLFFKDSASEMVMKEVEDLDNRIKLMYYSGHLYIIRNLVNDKYVPYATIAMEVKVEDVFGSLENIVWQQDSLIYLDDVLLSNIESEKRDELMPLELYAKDKIIDGVELRKNEILNWYDKDKSIASYSTYIENQRLTYIVRIDKPDMLNENMALVYTYLIVAVLLIPLLLFTFYYFYTNISQPISKLIKASEKIENGEFGYEVEKFDRNEEFGKLINNFNHMSVSLEESFNRIYAEEVAVRDANMQALQSQINPHFLNNTLEIINWKARMSGNKDVSGMVESLGVMMEATMNRANQSFISIREELKYVDAYLYIIDQRFGDKFIFEKEIDEKLYDLQIPRLIVQPLVENMVEHGVDEKGIRTGRLKIYEDSEYLYIVVENKGNLTKEAEEKIAALLNAEKKGGQSGSIGIRNVNLRLKLLYGEESGLKISNETKNLTVSEIKIDKKRLANHNLE